MKTKNSTTSPKRFYARGKLLLTGEYVVLDGATALALPTKKGQSLVVSPSIAPYIHWQSFDHDENCWFSCSFETAAATLLEALPNPKCAHKFDTKIGRTLYKILSTAQRLNPDFLEANQGYNIQTHLEFDRHWGLGSSSTLIANIAQWAKVDAFVLLEQSFGGSGYDIACAQQNTPILYTRKTAGPQIQKLTFAPPFHEQLFFVYRNQKQDSKTAISYYRQLKKNFLNQVLDQINALTHQIIDCRDLKTFEALITQHEQLLSKLLDTPTIKSQLFPDYPGAIKSLGGWGGDFVLATGDNNAQNYFRNKGYMTILTYAQMVC